MHLLKLPLFRLLAINLAIGAVIAILMVIGLLVLNPLNLRKLIFSDHEPAAVIGILMFDFFITFGSAAMGTAIMALGRGPEGDASVDRQHKAASADL